jgi:hypothetical protein
MFNKPSFGVPENLNPENSNTTKQEEIGAIWDNSGKMNIRFKIPKSKLMELVEGSKTDAEGNVLLGFTAVPNKSHNGDSKRPKFRIFERQLKTAAQSPQ